MLDASDIAREVLAERFKEVVARVEAPGDARSERVREALINP